MKTGSESFGKNIARGISKKLNKILSNPYRKLNINWLYIKYLKHLPPGGDYSHQLLGHKISFSNGHEYLHGLNEIFVEEVYKQNLPNDATIIDCGANIGLSVLYYKIKFPKARILAFEPDHKNFELLSKNIRKESSPNIELHNEAVWIENTEISFEAAGNMGSKIDLKASSAVKVKARRLKDMLSKPVDFLKLDIEGAEYEVIKDIAPELGHVKNMFVEYHGNFNEGAKLTEILNIVHQAGFHFYIKEAAPVHVHPFVPENDKQFDVQLNIFCFKAG